jgi:CRISPR/Cas system-associated exonuclease Cas4 (RecB family)
MSRGKKPSCSSFPRYSECVGSYQIEQLCPEPPESYVAGLGIDVHASLAGESISLSEEGEHLKALCEHKYNSLVLDVASSETDTNLNFPLVEGEVQTLVEQRLWWGDRWSGQADRIDLWGDRALVVDYKTGRGAVEPAESNLQLRGLAVLVKRKFPALKKVYVAIIAPMSIGVTLAAYDEEGLAAATEDILDLIAEVNKEHAPRTPTPNACKYCRAKSVCPEVSEKALTLRSNPAPVTLSADKLGELLTASEFIEGYIESLRTEAKVRLGAGAKIPGWTTKAGRTSRAIPDASAAFTILADKMSPEDFASACKVSVPSLEKAFAKSTGLKGKEAKVAFESAVAPVMETKTGDFTLAKEVA